MLPYHNHSCWGTLNQHLSQSSSQHTVDMPQCLNAAAVADAKAWGPALSCMATFNQVVWRSPQCMMHEVLLLKKVLDTDM